jgi:cytosine/adenosine deaminase-related metal-dependent hydrolase
VSASLVIRGCLALLGEDAELTPEPVDVVLKGARIAAITPAGTGVGETAIDGRNGRLTPGMINGHLHSHEHFQKGRFDNLPLELRMNYVRPPRRGDHESWVDASDAWRAATRGGAKALGRGQDLGKIEAGAAADLVLYSLNSSPFVPANNLLQQLVHAERGASIRNVLVDGRVVMDNGELTGIDEVSILAETQAEYQTLRPLYDEAENSVARMMPALERIHQRCACHPISADTHQARLC